MYCLNEVNVIPLGGNKTVTDSGWTTLTISDFGGLISGVLPITASVSSGDILRCYFYRDGYDASDNEPFFNALYGWTVSFI